MTEQSLKATVQSDLTDAIRQRDAGAVGHAAPGAHRHHQRRGRRAPEARELSDDEVLKVLAKEAKKRKEAATAYTDAGRPELAAKEEAELAVLEAYLPAQLSDDELTSIVAAAIEQTGATGMPQLGQVMKAAQGVVAGRADGGRVAAAVKAALTQGLSPAVCRGPVPRGGRLARHTSMTKGPLTAGEGPLRLSAVTGWWLGLGRLRVGCLGRVGLRRGGLKPVEV